MTKVLVETVYCPGKEGNKTTTTYSVEPLMSHNSRNPLWVGETDFVGEVFEQIYTSSRYSGLNYQEPKINPKAPKEILDVTLKAAKKNWRCKVG